MTNTTPAINNPPLHGILQTHSIQKGTVMMSRWLVNVPCLQKTNTIV